MTIHLALKYFCHKGKNYKLIFQNFLSNEFIRNIIFALYFILGI